MTQSAVFLPLRLELRVVAPGLGAPPSLLRIRVFPDDVHLADHVLGFVQTDVLDEAALATAFWEDGLRGGLNEARLLAAWTRLCDAVGARRGFYLVRASTPSNLAAAQLGATPMLASPGLGTPSATTSVLALPSTLRFRVDFHDGTSRSADTTISGPVRVGTPPLGTPEDPERTPEEDALWSDLQWMVDFGAALAKGLAVEMDLTGTTALDHGLARVTVSGVGASPTDLERLLDGHAATRGLAFVADGTPTNNTDEHGAGRSSAWGVQQTFPLVWDWVNESRSSLPADCVAARWADALGLGPLESLYYTSGAKAEREPVARACALLVADQLVKPSIERVLDPGAHTAEIESIHLTVREFAAEHLRPAGPYAPLRIGDTPYGLLPVAHPDSLPRYDGSSTSVLAEVLHTARRSALFVAERLPPHGRPLMQRLSRVPHPSGFVVAPWRALNLTGVITDLETQLAGLSGYALGASFSPVWGSTYGALESFVADLKAAVSSGAYPDHPGDPEGVHTLGVPVRIRLGELTKEAFALHKEAVKLVKRRRVPDSWDWPVDGYEWTSNLEDRLSDSGVYPTSYDRSVAEAFARGSTETKRRNNADRIHDLLGRDATNLRSLGRQRQVLLAWRSDERAIGEMLSLAYEAFYASDSRAGRAGAILAQLHARLPVGPYVLGDIRDHEPVASQAWTGGELFSEAGFPVSSDWQVLQGELDDTGSYGLGAFPDATQTAWFFRAAVGAVSYRMDAWYTAFAKQALLSQTSLTVGALGVVFDVPPFLTLFAAPASEGYVLAPTGPHAATAAVLRSGWLAHEHEGGHSDGTRSAGRSALAISLTGQRVRWATQLARALREGQALGPLVGRVVEERLRDSGNATEISGLRTAVMGDVNTPVDGLQALRAVHQVQRAAEGEDADSEAPSLTSTVRGHLAEVAQDLDSLRDLLQAEGVHQLLSRRLERAEVALGALTPGKGAIPSSFEVLHTEPPSPSERLEVVIGGPLVVSGAGARPRERVAPALDEWLGTWVDLTRWTVELEVGSATARVSLASLGLRPLDVVLESLDEQALLVRAALSAGLPTHDLTWTDTDHSQWRAVARKLGRVVQALRPLDGDARHGTQDWDALGLRIDAILTARRTATTMTSPPGPEDVDDLRTLATILLDHGSLPLPFLTASPSQVAEQARRFHEAWGALQLEVAALEAELDAARALADPVTDPAERATLRKAQVAIGRRLVRTLYGGLPAPGAIRSASPPRTSTAPATHPLRELARTRAPLGPLQAAVTLATGLELLGEGPAPPSLVQHEAVVDSGRELTLWVGPAPTAAWEGYALDAWSEALPPDTVTAGLAMHVDVPASQAPATLVLSPEPPGGWTADAAEALAGEFASLVRLRGMGPAELDIAPGLGSDAGFVPLTFSAKLPGAP